jgi:hypothetical protein
MCSNNEKEHPGYAEVFEANLVGVVVIFERRIAKKVGRVHTLASY